MLILRDYETKLQGLTVIFFWGGDVDRVSGIVRFARFVVSGRGGAFSRDFNEARF